MDCRGNERFWRNLIAFFLIVAISFALFAVIWYIGRDLQNIKMKDLNSLYEFYLKKESFERDINNISEIELKKKVLNGIKNEFSHRFNGEYINLSFSGRIISDDAETARLIDITREIDSFEWTKTGKFLSLETYHKIKKVQSMIDLSDDNYEKILLFMVRDKMIFNLLGYNNEFIFGKDGNLKEYIKNDYEFILKDKDVPLMLKELIEFRLKSPSNDPTTISKIKDMYYKLKNEGE